MGGKPPAAFLGYAVRMVHETELPDLDEIEEESEDELEAEEDEEIE